MKLQILTVFEAFIVEFLGRLLEVRPSLLHGRPPFELGNFNCCVNITKKNLNLATAKEMRLSQT